MKNIIIVIGDKKYQFETKEEVMQNLLGDSQNDYNSMSEKEKKERRYYKAYINTRGSEESILDLQEEIIKGKENTSIEGKFLIDNDEVYVMSLLRISDILLLEDKDADIFAKSIDKTEIKENYIILNSFVNEFIENYRNECLKKTNDLER